MPASSFQPTSEHVIAARRLLARQSLADFACMVDIPTVPLTDAEDEDRFSVIRLDSLVRHHELLCSSLQRVANGEIPNAMFLLPPGSAKSTYADVVFVPWYMATRPRKNVILGSYAANIARKQGRRARQLIKSRAFRNLFPGIELSAASSAADEWMLSTGGEYMAGGLLGGLTGNRAALGILDDPVAGREEAESETIRQKTWDAYVDDFCSRLTPGAPQVLIQTRWHDDDVAGRILPEGWDGESGLIDGRDGRQWFVVCLPAICDREDDPLGREIGETLWPEWFSHEHWRPFQRNARTWASLYQQRPSPPSGSFFQREWFKRYRPADIEAVKDDGGKIIKPALAFRKYLTSDHAPTDSDTSDPSGCRVWGVAPNSDLYILDGFIHRATMDVTADRIVGNLKTGPGRDPEPPPMQGMIRKHQPFAWFPEDDNNWKTAEPFILRQMKAEGVRTRIEPMSPHGQDKAAKAQSFQGLAAMGQVYVPEGPEGDEIIEQYVKFPAGKHDEEVDMAAIMGRAIAMAHPAIVPPEAAKPAALKGINDMTWDELMAQQTPKQERV